MWKYLIKRVLLMFPTMIGVAVLTFVLIRVIPGDVVELRYAGDRGAVSQEILDKERARLGLDKPLHVQFARWMLGVARLDFGESMWTGSTIWEEIRLRFALSFQVAIMATLVAVVLAIPLGVLAALRQDTWVDYAVRIFSIAGLATPSFWLGIVFILFLLVVFRWLPPMVYTPFWVDPWENMKQLIWPALAVGYRYSAVATRMTRSAMLEVLREDYIRTAGQGPGAAAGAGAPRPQERDAARAHGGRPRVRLPHRRARGHRAGLQPERARPALRAGRRAPRLHPDPGAGDARGGRVHRRQLPDGRGVRVDRSPHPVPVRPWP
jgi:ABC-type microcin C transport system permease subunit YejB